MTKKALFLALPLAAFVALGAMPAYATSAVDVEIRNDATGDRSTNDAYTEIDYSLNVENENKTDISDKECLDLNTGNNQVSDNDGDVNVQTGNIKVDKQVENVVGEVEEVPTPTEKPSVTPTVTPVPTEKEAVTTPSVSPTAVEGVSEAGVGGMPEELAAAGANLVGLFALAASVVGSGLYAYQRRKKSLL